MATLIADQAIGLGSAVTETTDLVREIRTLGVTDQFHERIDRRITTLERLSARVNFALNVAPQVFIGVGMLVLLGTFAMAAQFSNGSFATLGGTALLLFRALSFGQQVSGIQQRLNRSIPYTIELNSFLDQAAEAGANRSSGTERISSIDSIEFAETSFTYETEAAPAINQTSFTLRRPGLIAVYRTFRDRQDHDRTSGPRPTTPNLGRRARQRHPDGRRP